MSVYEQLSHIQDMLREASITGGKLIIESDYEDGKHGKLSAIFENDFGEIVAIGGVNTMEELVKLLAEECYGWLL